MSTPFIVPQKSGKQHKEPLKMKQCAFPGCKVKQKMTGKAVYCNEHRARKYRKIIDGAKIEAKKKEEEAKSANQIIKHKFKEVIIIKIKCACCGKEFSIKLFPSVNVYPKFCSDHRNEYKRNLYLKSQNS